MSAPRGDLAARKEALIARSALQRARIRYEYVALRADARSRMRLPLGLLMGLLVRRTGGAGAGWIGKAAAILALVRTGASIVKLFRGRR